MGTVGATAGAQQAGPLLLGQAQAEALRRRDAEAVDWKHVTDEIEELAREAERRLKHHCRTVIQHFLQLQYGEGCDTDLVVCCRTAPGSRPGAIDCFARPGRWDGRRPSFVFVHQAVTPIQNTETRWREHKRLSQEWSRLLPQKNPYTRQRAEAKFWLPALIRLLNQPQSCESAVPSPPDTP